MIKYEINKIYKDSLLRILLALLSSWASCGMKGRGKPGGTSPTRSALRKPGTRKVCRDGSGCAKNVYFKTRKEHNFSVPSHNIWNQNNSITYAIRDKQLLEARKKNINLL